MDDEDVVYPALFCELKPDSTISANNDPSVGNLIATDQAPQLLSAEYIGTVIGGIGAVGAPQMAAIIKSTSTAAALPVTGSLTTAVNHKYSIKGIIRTATTFNSLMKLRVTNSAGTVTPLAGSYQKMWRISDLDAAGIFL